MSSFGSPTILYRIPPQDCHYHCERLEIKGPNNHKQSTDATSLVQTSHKARKSADSDFLYRLYHPISLHLTALDMSTPIIPHQQTAIIAGPTGDFEVSTSIQVPDLEPGEILIKTSAVALNPVDTKLVGAFLTPGCIFGFDCAGVVVAIGSDVHKDLKVGDRVCGSASGSTNQVPFLFFYYF